eukprot:8367815-Lingulodinium_polyedra.AAC.1
MEFTRGQWGRMESTRVQWRPTEFHGAYWRPMRRRAAYAASYVLFPMSRGVWHMPRSMPTIILFLLTICTL